MTLLYRISAAAVCAVLTALLIRRSNPELAALISIGAVIVLLFLGLKISEGLTDMKDLLTESFGLSDSYMRPVLKCVAASIITKLTADLCRDSSQTATASAVELAGSLCALGMILPLLISMLRMVEGFL